MTFTVTIKARAVPVTVKSSDDAEPMTVDAWQERSLHLNDSATLSITEAEPAADVEPASADPVPAEMEDEAAEEDERMRRRPPKRAPAADSDSTQIG